MDDADADDDGGGKGSSYLRVAGQVTLVQGAAGRSRGRHGIGTDTPRSARVVALVAGGQETVLMALDLMRLHGAGFGASASPRRARDVSLRDDQPVLVARAHHLQVSLGVLRHDL